MMTCMKEKTAQTWHKGLFFNDTADKKLFDDMNLLSLYRIYSFLFLKYNIFILRIKTLRNLLVNSDMYEYDFMLESRHEYLYGVVIFILHYFLYFLL